MENDLKKRILARMEELDLLPETVSTRMGMDRSYLRKLLERTHQSPRENTLRRLAGVLDVSVTWLSSGKDEQPDVVKNRPTIPASSNGAPMSPAEIVMAAQSILPKDVPVMGTAAGSHIGGSFQLEGGVVDFVRRPPALIGARDIYSLYVEGMSMEPQFFSGDLIYINPNKPARLGDAIVLQTKNGPHTREEATLGIYRRINEKVIVLGKHNPIAEIEIPREYVRSMHKVLTMNELFGV